jgi:hypothetical protein
MKSIVRIAIAAGVLAVPGLAAAQPIACRSAAGTVKAVTISEDYFPVKTRFQMDVPNLEPLLTTSISVTGSGLSCVLATFSAIAKPTDNYMVFQVTLDGVPMLGHTVTFPNPLTPVVIETEETDLNQPRMVSHQFFQKVAPGVHTVTVNVAAGSNILAPFYPTVEAPVLALQYR